MAGNACRLCSHLEMKHKGKKTRSSSHPHLQVTLGYLMLLGGGLSSCSCWNERFWIQCASLTALRGRVSLMKVSQSSWEGYPSSQDPRNSTSQIAQPTCHKRFIRRDMVEWLALLRLGATTEQKVGFIRGFLWVEFSRVIMGRISSSGWMSFHCQGLVGF